MSTHDYYMRRAIEIARQTAIVDKAGGPFGCVIVKDDEIVGEGANRVIADGDPTCHAEMNAIRVACNKLGTRDLSGCVVYSTGEPCPMCYAACWWARVEAIYYASNSQDANEHGDFDDATIFDAVKLPIQDRFLAGTELLRNEMLDLWEEFHKMADRPSY